jgi:hypothetical protein
MNKTACFFCFIFLLFFSYSCYKCKDLTYCPLPETGETYFSSYTDSSFWIYQNRNQSKIDSVYVENYKSSRIFDKTVDCVEGERREMIIRSKFLSSNSISCLYENPNCESSYFVMQGFGYSIDFSARNGVDTLYSINTWSNTITIDSLILPTGSRFFNVVMYNGRFWFAPHIGLIQYVSQENNDTLFLIKHFSK